MLTVLHIFNACGSVYNTLFLRGYDLVVYSGGAFTLGKLLTKKILYIYVCCCPFLKLLVLYFHIILNHECVFIDDEGYF